MIGNHRSALAQPGIEATLFERVAETACRPTLQANNPFGLLIQ